MIWALLLVMTLAAVSLALWPLLLKKTIPDNSHSEIDFYKTQLVDIERDIERGHLPAEEAQATRAEMARKLIALHKEQAEAFTFQIHGAHRHMAFMVGLVLLPLLSVWLYSLYGHPTLSDMPLAARSDVETGTDPVSEAIAKIEAEIVTNPDNLKAWSALAPVYLRLGRYSDAVIAYLKILQIKGEDASIRAHLGEARVAAANGIVTPEAKEDLTRALAADPTLALAQYYLALGIEQAGDTQQALALYTALLDKVTDRPNWTKVIGAKIAQLKGEATAPAAGAANGQNEQDMIAGMVNRLAARLEQDGGSAEEWGRLIRSYSVLAKPDQAERALTKARQAHQADPAATAQLQTLAKQLDLPWR